MRNCGNIKPVVLLDSSSYKRRESLRFYLVLLFLCVVKQAGAEQTKPEKLTFSYVRHPVIVKKLIPIIKETYARIGIEIELLPQPSKRNLKLVSSGLVDGEVAFTEALAHGYTNLLIIKPRLSQGKFVLLCRKPLACNQSVLADEDQTVVVTDTSLTRLQQLFSERLKVDFYPINEINKIPKLVFQKRFDYGIYILNINSKEAPYPELIDFYVLHNTNTVHILNDKLTYIEEMVSKSLAEVLAEKSASK